MRVSGSLPLISLAIAATEASTVSPPSHIFSNPSSSSSSTTGGRFRIPTAYESAVLGRRILALTPLGNIGTVFPADDKEWFGVEENRPAGLGGMPHSLMEYVADCEGNGNPTFLAINIETTFKNVGAGSNVSLAQQWTPPYPPAKRIQQSSSPPDSPLSRLKKWLGLGCHKHHDDDDDGSEPSDTVPYSAANLPRFSLLGHVEKIDTSTETAKKELAACFVARHPDARYWLPGNRIHESMFVRLVVEHVYWVGGFGDRAYIGWIPADDWARVSRGEWEAVRLPGEKKGWKEWQVGSDSIAAGDL